MWLVPNPQLIPDFMGTNPGKCVHHFAREAGVSPGEAG